MKNVSLLKRLRLQSDFGVCVCVFGNGDPWCLWACETGEAAEEKHSSDWLLSPSRLSAAGSSSFAHVTPSWRPVRNHGRAGESAAGPSLLHIINIHKPP